MENHKKISINSFLSFKYEKIRDKEGGKKVTYAFND